MTESTFSNTALCVADSSGDLILIVGGRIDPDNTLRIQVSSHVLGLVSTVFKAMFSSRYHEGSMLNATSAQPVSISLSEDDPEAVSLACRMFHYNLEDTLEEPSLGLLDKLATFCDKYDCARAVRPSTRFWTNRYSRLGGVTGYHNLLVISYMFDDPALFGTVTRIMVRRSTGNYMDFVLEHGRNILPSCLCFALEEKRKTLNSRIMVAVQELIEPLLSCYHETSIDGYFKELYRIGVFPSRLTNSVDSTIASLKMFNPTILNTINCSCGICHRVGNISEKIKKIGTQAGDWAECMLGLHAAWGS